jgi:hypothetical protein
MGEVFYIVYIFGLLFENGTEGCVILLSNFSMPFRPVFFVLETRFNTTVMESTYIKITIPKTQRGA